MSGPAPSMSRPGHMSETGPTSTTKAEVKKKGLINTHRKGLINTNDYAKLFTNEGPDRQEASDTVLVIVYDKDSFFNGHQLTLVRRDEDMEFNIEQEIIDRSSTKYVFKCQDDHQYKEDLCLKDCLVSKFVNEVNCLHARLYFLANETIKDNVSICTSADLTNYTRILMRKKAEEKQFIRLDRSTDEEFGYAKIRQILGDFFTEDLTLRCGCPIPCRRKNLELAKWPTMRKNFRQKRNTKTKNVFFQMKSTIKVYSHHVLYSGSDLVADIGGYLGLFLGLSVFGLAQLITHNVLKESKKIIGLAKEASTTIDKRIKSMK